ncbi:hypothetical protein LSTR_LSTR010024 [Laodelphax striatellus]|uniref:Neurotransmitter-gated ion-channel ligand-binding domain-containing protein n=1 Tax=Laodelphax striatellus TaxID=195883 RepID=A0A482XEG2_LAOST|nr:hypothetical protein LSTR_LSTR010024 [Laodelphax striatellus]
MEVSISLFINRVSGVDESKEEISLDVFLQVYWVDHRVNLTSEVETDHIELTWKKDQSFWVPDLYIRQLREMRVLSLFQDMASIRLYRNHTMRVSIGATVILKCDMDFDLYPLDVQKCAVDFSSYKYTVNDMKFRWQNDPPLSFPSDFSAEGYRLPRYVVSFESQEDMHIIYYGEGNHSTARMLITMSREIRSHLLESYLPSSLFVIISWGSFVVMPEVVPGRMVLLVTTLLSLVTMFDTVRNNSPSALELKCIEVWLISCTLFVFLALMEYFIVLFGIRYDKHWRHKKRDDIERRTASVAVNASSNNNTNHKEAPHSHVVIADRAKLFLNSRIQPHQSTGGGENAVAEHKTDMPAELQQDATPETGERKGPGENLAARRRFKLVTEHVLLYAGSQRGMMDQVSLGLFPLCFIIFTIIYWVSYMSEARRRAEASLIGLTQRTLTEPTMEHRRMCII